MLIILFGLSGAGKNYTATLLQKHFNFFWWDADDALSDAMLHNLKNKISFTQKMRNDLTRSIIKKITTLQKTHSHIVVTQGLYKVRNRIQLSLAFPKSHFIWIRSNEALISERLHKRGGESEYVYAKLIEPNFEVPPDDVVYIVNDKDEHSVLNQFKQILSRLETP